MAISSTGSRTTPARPGGALPWAVLMGSVLQVAAPVVTFLGPGSSPAQGSGADLAITPVGWAFAIWGPIYALALAQAIAVLVRRVAVPRRLQVDQLVLFLGGTAWIAVAAFDTSIGTAVALLVMAVAAVDAVLTLARPGGAPEGFARLTRLGVGLYAGWVTAALFLNAGSALTAAGATDPSDLGWQAVLLAVAAVVLSVVATGSRGNPAYAVAGVWALIGIAVTTGGAGRTGLLVLSLAGAAVLVVATAVAATVRGTARPV